MPRRLPFRRLALTLVVAAVAGCGAEDDGSQRIYDLSRDPTPDHVEAIRGYLAAPSAKERAAAIFKLVDLEVPDSLELALAGLGDEDGFVRATCAKLLGDLREDSAVPALSDLVLRDSDPVVRQRAAESLTQLGGPLAREALTQALQDPLSRVRLAAVRGMADLGPEDAAEALLPLLLEDPEWEIRAQAARGLGRSANIEMAPALRAALEDRNEFVRAAAAAALRELGADESEEAAGE